MSELGNMSAMIESLRDELVRGGLSEQALQLKGIELYDDGSVRTALSTLEQMTVDTEVSKCVRRHLMGMMRQYLAEAQMAC